jgi:hydrogenase expression/formation protein HypE
MDREQQELSMQGPVCPVPISQREHIILGHGSGGKLSQELLRRYFYPSFDNPALMQRNDAAVIPSPGTGRLALTTDAHVVWPLFFPGGDIGRLAICGTVNDLAVVGARPQWMSASFILEEGLALETLERIVRSMKSAAEEAGIAVVAGDTKVVERGKADQIYISTSGVGWVPQGRHVSGDNAQPGDVVLLSGPIGNHGVAVLAERGELGFQTTVRSDIAPLNGLVEAMFAAGRGIHVMRDPTRGGLATTLNEITDQSGVGIELQETSIPLDAAVEAACEMLGLDPLYIANEGKLVAITTEEDAEPILQAMRAHPLGQQACRIGTVVEQPAGRVLMRTAIGGTRIVDTLAGEMLPRIC